MLTLFVEFMDTSQRDVMVDSLWNDSFGGNPESHKVVEPARGMYRGNTNSFFPENNLPTCSHCCLVLQLYSIFLLICLF